MITLSNSMIAGNAEAESLSPLNFERLLRESRLSMLRRQRHLQREIPFRRMLPRFQQHSTAVNSLTRIDEAFKPTSTGLLMLSMECAIAYWPSVTAGDSIAANPPSLPAVSNSRRFFDENRRGLLAHVNWTSDIAHGMRHRLLAISRCPSLVGLHVDQLLQREIQLR